MSDSPNRPAKNHDLLHALVMLLVLGVAAVVSLLALAPSRDVAPESGFDTDRAWRHLEFIASDPRPLGSAHHRAVREYLVEQFESSGLQVQVQDARVRHSRILRGLPVQVMNVIARLPGTADTGKAVALAAHYDSAPMPSVPGAGDDAAAVAALLEVARILSDGPPANDVIFLITDGEELGLFGARAFVDEHPWRDDIGVIFNFEARGTSGPSIMFETSDGNAFLIEQYARVAPHPVASSLSDAVYQLLPNDTDFTIFRRAGMQGVNFAFIGDYAFYHTPDDTVENLDIRSMRHHGVQALALARQFGDMSLHTMPVTGDAVYFNLPWLGVVRYPQHYASLIATIAAVLTAVAVLLSASCGGARLSRILMGWMMLVLSIALACGASWGLLLLLPADRLARHADLSIGGFALVALFCVSLVLGLFHRRVHALELGAGALILWMSLSLLSAGYLVGGSYLFVWPTLFLAGGLIAVTVLGRERELEWSGMVILGLSGIPLVVILTPIIYLIFLGLQITMAAVLIIPVVIALWGLSPQLKLINTTARWAVPLVSAMGAAICLILAASAA